MKSPATRKRRPSAPPLTPRDALRTLSWHGPHRVLRGNLAVVGTPGVIYTPASGFGLPAVAFGHGWLTGASHYSTLLEHLASWGIVVVAPNTERGPVPSHLDLSTDLLAALDVVTGIRLGVGEISVDPARLGLVGHGMGGSAAVIAAARRPVAALAALFPGLSAPDAAEFAPRVTAPALVLTGDDIDSQTSAARPIADRLAGPVWLYQIAGATMTGLVEGRRALAALGVGGTEKRTLKTTRALLAGHLLHTFTGDERYAVFAGDTPAVPRTTLLDPHAEPEPTPPPSRLAVARAVLSR